MLMPSGIVLDICTLHLNINNMKKSAILLVLLISSSSVMLAQDHSRMD